MLGYVRRAGNRVLRQTGRTVPEGLPGPYPSRYAVPLGLGCIDSSNVLGDTADRIIGGVKEGDTSLNFASIVMPN